MSDFVIFGGKPLSGSITADGSKNAVLPIIFASAAMRGVSVIENVPEISDVDTALLLLKELGACALRTGTTLTLDTRHLHYKSPDKAACLAIRASTYLIGAELARFGKAEISAFGGCNFDVRPIDLHIYAAECMGAVRDGNFLYLDSPRSSEIHFKKVSVGASANALILASSLPVTTEIYGYAKEPHIKALAEFLSTAGALIEFTEEKISVRGGSLGGAHIKIPPDPIETGTYALLSLLSGGRVEVTGSIISELSALLTPLTEAGVRLVKCESGFRLLGALERPVSLTAAPYPALPTDLQPLTVPVLAFYKGGSVRDTVFPNRFGYLSSLREFGLCAQGAVGEALIFPSGFHRAKAKALDLRGGAALLFPALISAGKSRITSAELIKRGYGGIVRKLRALGADIHEA